MRSDGIKGGDVGEPKLTQSVLKDRYASVRGRGRIRCRVNRFDDLVDLGGDEGVLTDFSSRRRQSKKPAQGPPTWQLKEVQLQNARNYWNFISFQNLTGNGLACIDRISKVVGCSQGNIHKPNRATSLITLQVRVI